MLTRDNVHPNSIELFWYTSLLFGTANQTQVASHVLRASKVWGCWKSFTEKELRRTIAAGRGGPRWERGHYEKALQDLVKMGFLTFENDMYCITDKFIEKLEKLIQKVV